MTFLGDVLALYGAQEAELKAGLISTFTAEGVEVNCWDKSMMLRVLVATSGCIGAGLDSSSIYLVTRIGLPPSILDFIQEMGRCGRAIRMEEDNIDKYVILVTLDDFLYMYSRIYNNKDRHNLILQKEQQERLEMNRLLDVLQFLVLSKCCWHVELEKRCIIDNNVLHEEVCGTSCPVCTGATTKLFLPINKVNLCRVLVKLFCESGKSDITPQNVAKYIIDTDNYELSVYGKKTKNW